MYGRQVARLRFEESGFGPEQIGHGIQSRGKAVLRDAKAFLRFVHGRFCRFNSLLRGFQSRPCLTNLQADSRFRLSLLRSGTARRSFALRYLCLVPPPLNRFQRRPIDNSQFAPPRSANRWRSASNAPCRVTCGR